MSTDTPLRIRNARAGDAQALHAMMQALARMEQSLPALRTDPAMLARALGARPPACHALIAESDGQPCGYLSYTFGHSIWAASPVLLLDDLYVDARRRGHGIGSELMDAARRIAASHGCSQLRWTVETGNQRAIAFYRRLGARVQVRGLCTLAVPAPAPGAGLE